MWTPSVTLSQQEEQIVKKIRKAKLFVFLRQHRHELFDEAFQEELASLYRKAERGQPPITPAILALALILEAYMGVSDDEVIEATIMDRRCAPCRCIENSCHRQGRLRAKDLQNNGLP